MVIYSGPSLIAQGPATAVAGPTLTGFLTFPGEKVPDSFATFLEAYERSHFEKRALNAEQRAGRRQVTLNLSHLV